MIKFLMMVVVGLATMVSSGTVANAQDTNGQVTYPVITEGPWMVSVKSANIAASARWTLDALDVIIELRKSGAMIVSYSNSMINDPRLERRRFKDGIRYRFVYSGGVLADWGEPDDN